MRQFLAILVVPVLISPAALIILSELAMAQQTTAKPELPVVGRDSMPLPLKVIGTRVVNSRNEPVRLRGVNIAGLEWSSNGEGHILTTVDTAIRDWHVNVIRLPLAQDRWFGKVPEPKDEGEAYRALVNQIVQRCAAAGCYVILDLHWSDMGQWGTRIGQHVMPDHNSVAFWQNVAATYKNHPAVIFDLYNEPHDVTWDVWQRGGRSLTSDSSEPRSNLRGRRDAGTARYRSRHWRETW